MEGLPWELNELPRSQHNPVGDGSGLPPIREERRLPPIREERRLPRFREERTGKYLRRDAPTSTNDLGTTDADGVRGVRKGQINALAKMLSALRR